MEKYKGSITEPTRKPGTLIGFYDIETNGFLNQMDRVHCLVIEFNDGRFLSCADKPGYMPIVEGLRELAKADIRCGHNIQGFDEPAIRKVYPWWEPKGDILDTLVLARLVFPEIHRNGPNPHKVLGGRKKSHRLEDWGRRLGQLKGEYKGGWEHWNLDMQEYCDQDVRVTVALYKYLMHPERRPSSKAVQIEHKFAHILNRQMRRGWRFDMDAAIAMAADLKQRLDEIELALIDYFGSWWDYKTRDDKTAAGPDSGEDIIEISDEEAEAKAKPVVEVITKTMYRKLSQFPDIRKPRYGKRGQRLEDYVGPPKEFREEGSQYVKIERVQFNPGSRTHVRNMLRSRFGWKPKRFTEKGAAIVDDAVLQDLANNIPECQMLADYYLLKKRLGQLADGPKAWIKLAVYDEELDEYRIFGRVITNGAVTGRCTHSSPNLAQVPSKKKEYIITGKTEEERQKAREKKADLKILEGIDPARTLFIARKGHKLVGFDASSLELCMLGHFTYPYDGGAYATVVGDPNADPHAWARDTIGVSIMGPGTIGREKSKTTVYAKIYGGGKEKIGSIIEPTAKKQQKISIGQDVDEAIAENFTGLGQLEEAIHEEIDDKGYLVGLDGRRLSIRMKYAGLNTLLQNAGAVVMKVALIILDRELQKAGLRPGIDYEFVGNIHDEVQAEVLDEHVDTYIKHAEQCVRLAGEWLKMKCPLRGNADKGDNWLETH